MDPSFMTRLGSSRPQASLPAFERFFREQYHAVVRIAFGVVGNAQAAQDVAQDVFISAFKRFPDPGQSDHACAWVRVAAAHTALNAVRGERRRDRRQLLSGVEVPPMGPEETVLDREWILLAERLRQPDAAQRPVIRDPWRMPRRLAGASLGTSTAVGAGVVAIGVGAAAALTSVYAPTHVAPLHVSLSDAQAIANLFGLSRSQLPGSLPASGSRKLAFGDVSWTSAGLAQEVSSIARASALTHLAYSAPATLPAGVGSPSGIAVQPQRTATVTFSQKAGPGIAGSTLEITGGPAILIQYGSRSGVAGLTTLAIAVMERPTASSTGATASQLEAFLLSRGGLPSGLAQELRLLGSPGPTLPVPVPSDMTAQQPEPAR